MTIIVTILVGLASAITAALIGVALRPRREDAMPRAIGDAPGVSPSRPRPRGGYAAMDERDPITRSGAP